MGHEYTPARVRWARLRFSIAGPLLAGGVGRARREYRGALPSPLAPFDGRRDGLFLQGAVLHVIRLQETDKSSPLTGLAEKRDLDIGECRNQSSCSYLNPLAHPRVGMSTCYGRKT